MTTGEFTSGMINARRALWKALTKRHNEFYFSHRRMKLAEDHDRPTVFVHIPRTGGTSLGAALGHRPPGHFTFEELAASRSIPMAEVIYVTRDPLDRLRSIFRHLKRIARRQPRRHLRRRPLTRNQATGRWGFAALPFWILASFPTLEGFVRSSTLRELVETDHFFLRPQADYLAGLDAFTGRVHHLRFEKLTEDAERLGVRLPHLNASPELPRGKLMLSADAEQRVRDVYAPDYELLQAVGRGAG